MHQFTFLSSGMMKGYESGLSYRLSKLPEDALLSIIGEDGKDCMDGSAEK